MKITDESLADAVFKLRELAWMPGFPDTDEKLLAYARHFLRIVHGEPLEAVSVEGGVASAGHMAWSGAIPDGVVTDVDWLIQTVGDTCERFPMPVRMREIYMLRFTPENTAELRTAMDAAGAE